MPHTGHLRQQERAGGQALAVDARRTPLRESSGNFRERRRERRAGSRKPPLDDRAGQRFSTLFFAVATTTWSSANGGGLVSLCGRCVSSTFSCRGLVT